MYVNTAVFECRSMVFHFPFPFPFFEFAFVFVYLLVFLPFFLGIKNKRQEKLRRMEDRRDRDHQDRKRKYHSSSSRDERRSDFKRRHHDPHHERSSNREFKERYSREDERLRETERADDPEWRSKWDHILFKPKDFIAKGSPEYAEFRGIFDIRSD